MFAFFLIEHPRKSRDVFFWKTNPRRAAPPQRLVLVFNPKYHTQNDASDDIYPLELPKTICYSKLHDFIENVSKPYKYRGSNRGSNPRAPVRTSVRFEKQAGKSYKCMNFAGSRLGMAIAASHSCVVTVGILHIAMLAQPPAQLQVGPEQGTLS